MKLKRSLLVFLISLLSFSMTTPLSVGASPQQVTLKPIDMYLIAGQSNASGYSTHNGQFTEEFTNVGYAGETDKNRNTGTAPQRYLNFNQFKWSVTAGLGSYAAWMGPEYGMAKVFNGLYEGEKKAFIFKSAAGATALRNISHDFGNWLPPSKWGDGYVPDGSQAKGYQYHMFVENFKLVYEQLVDNGYLPVVRGMAWMQGESDIGYETTYEGLLKLLISDIRADIAEITGDRANLEMPFVIGKIAVFGEVPNKIGIRKFNEMQDKVASEVINVSTVSTSDLILVDSEGNIKGTDAYHFNGKDMETLGMRFGNELAKGRVSELEAEKEEQSNDSETGSSCKGSLGSSLSLCLGLCAIATGELLLKKKRK